MQVETLSKEIEEQERSYKSRLATQEKRAHENWVAARQLERRLEESKQEAAQLRHRLTQVEKDKEALLVAKENGTANGAADVDLIKPVIKRESCYTAFPFTCCRGSCVKLNPQNVISVVDAPPRTPYNFKTFPLMLPSITRHHFWHLLSFSLSLARLFPLTRAAAAAALIDSNVVVSRN